MNWAMIYQAEILGDGGHTSPCLLTIALITFSMNLMNTGLARCSTGAKELGELNG